MIYTNSTDYDAAEALGAKVKAAVNRWGQQRHEAARCCEAGRVLALSLGRHRTAGRLPAALGCSHEGWA